MPNMDYHNDFAVPLYAGAFDDYLDGMIQAIQTRKKEKAPKVWEFRVGDRIKMINTNPKYLNGALGTVKKINRTKVVIDLDNPQGRFYTNITTPLTMIEKV